VKPPGKNIDETPANSLATCKSSKNQFSHWQNITFDKFYIIFQKD